MGAMNRLGIRFVVPARQTTQPGGIGSLESILGLLKSLKIRALKRNQPGTRAIVRGLQYTVMHSTPPRSSVVTWGVCIK